MYTDLFASFDNMDVTLEGSLGEISRHCSLVYGSPGDIKPMSNLSHQVDFELF